MMSMTKKAVSRREAIALGVLGAAGVAVAGVKPTTPAFAEEGRIDTGPMVKAVIYDHITGKKVSERCFPLLTAAFESAGGDLSLNKVCREVEDGITLITSEFNIPLKGSAASERAVIDEVKEDAFSGIKATVVLGVNWGANKSTIQIQRGTFSVTQVNPLVIYSNTFYGMMQKEHYLSDVFNGKPLTITTEWPSQPFDAEADQWTCGGAVGGLLTDLTNGEQQDFTVEIYL